MSPDLEPALARLRDDLAAIRLELAVPDADGARRVRDDLVAQVDDYVLPRLRQMDAPALMVVGGSTGAGKSTLVNSLVGSVVTPAGVLRPTTRAPVLACHPGDLRWFEGERILPGLPRTTGGEPAPGTLHLVPTETLPAGLALLDSPDIDSVLSENRALANHLLAAADAWLFVTTAARYADAVPWEFLHSARDRGTSLSIVLNRVPDDAERDVPAHLHEMLREQGLADVDLLVVPETALADGLIPERDLSPVRAWLDALAADAQARAALIRRTLRGAIASLPARAGVVERAALEQLGVAGDLRAETDAAYAAAIRDVDTALRNGSLLRGEVLARWHEVVGTGDVMRAIESRVGFVRDRLRTVLTGASSADGELQAAVESRVEAVVRSAAERAAERTARAWRERTAGKALLASVPDVDRASPRLVEATDSEVRDWQSFVFDLVSREGASKRMTARVASLGVNGAGLAVMLAVFAHTGGLTGAETLVAGGTSAVGQKLLEAIFGDQAVRTLASRAREDLVERVERLLDDDAARFHVLLDSAAPDAEAFARLHAATDAVRRAA
ncbi:MAG: ABC transporter [Actinomycetota bacterium]|nr:ABC transporter [Actinomycetota bacterium]